MTNQELIQRFLESIVPEKANHVERKHNVIHDKDEFWGCCECYEDKYENKMRAQILENIKEVDIEKLLVELGKKIDDRVCNFCGGKPELISIDENWGCPKCKRMCEPKLP